MTGNAAPRRDFRPDIQGMRAIAVGSVLLFHAHVPGLDGGFVGVDVFYVISGFLITGLLLREVERSGRVDVVDFYARRLKRLAPVYLVVLAATLLVMLTLLPALYTVQFGGHLVGALLYVANVVLSTDVSGYFADAEPSPVLHFWSLAVEEQFYLAWPLLVLLVGRGHPQDVRRRFTRVVVPVVLVSFLLAVVLTPRFPTPSFYLLHTRAWELGLGALLACWPAVGRQLTDRARDGLVALGALGIIGSVLLLDGSTVFPGWAALPSVLGSAAILLAGTGRTSRLSQLLLENRPMVWLGDISYSLYLWHWPILVLPAAVHGAPLGLGWQVLLAGVSVLVARASHHHLEQRFQRLGIQGRRKAIIATSLGLTLALLLATVGGIVRAQHRLDGQSSSGGIPALQKRLFDVPRPLLTRYAGDAVSASGTIVTPRQLTPSLAEVKGDLSAIQTNGCAGRDDAATAPVCWGGDPEADRVLVLMGDSHAGHWWGAWDTIGRTEHYRVLALVMNACPVHDMGEVRTDLDEKRAAACRTFRRKAAATLDTLKPDVVVVSQTVYEYHAYSPDPDGFVGRWREGVDRAVARLPKHSRLLWLGDSPSYGPKDSSLPPAPACLSRHAEDPSTCRMPDRGPAVVAAEQASRELVEQAGGRYVDLSASLCTPSGCPMVADNNILYRDFTHVTSATSRLLTPVLADELLRTPKR